MTHHMVESHLLILSCISRNMTLRPCVTIMPVLPNTNIMTIAV
jgi:hypothetical protein